MLGLQPLLEGGLVGEGEHRQVGREGLIAILGTRWFARPGRRSAERARLPAPGTAARGGPTSGVTRGRAGTGPVGDLAGPARREHGQRRGRAGSGSGDGRLKLDVRDPDMELSDTGRAQAEALGKWLSELPEDDRPTKRRWSSPFNRALTTCQLATENLDIRVRTDERLRSATSGPSTA